MVAADASALAPPELLNQSARAQTLAVASGSVTCAALMHTTLEWIERVNPVVNAICTLVPERALESAQQADRRLAAGGTARPLEGLPIAIKDLAETEGVRTTYGSPAFAEHVPTHSVLYVQRLEAAGAIVLGKTNVPEFGAGSQTFNPLFGTTVTPYDPNCTSGGSSGGAAAALAARMLAIADGSDLGGSLRNPAAFCNVVGFRPSPGRVPKVPDRDGYNPLPIVGPMARSVDDLGLMLSVMAGPDQRAALSIDQPASAFAALRPANLAGCRIAVTEDLGMLPVVPEIRNSARSAADVFAQLGAELEYTEPDLHLAPMVFSRLRAQHFVTGFAELYRRSPEQMKDTVRWNIELGLSATPTQLGEAQRGLNTLRAEMLRFFATRELLILPTTQVLPFAKAIEWVREIEGQQQQDYLQWMASAWLLSVTGCPVVSVPCGFSNTGLPMGLQIVGPPGADRKVLEAALAYEQATGFGQQQPQWSSLL
ncbi:MAG: amidase [Pseudomonadales bacterium]